MNEEKNRLTAGADERTPSHPQYFSWINSTNEGSTEKQTLINLDYFKYLHDEYGMKLEIYAWDAGNLDGSRETYQTLGTSEKLKKQYPNGYAPIVKKASESGIRLGVWCGPDGFGDTAKTQEARHGQMVSLCRDYNFALFKMDGVCGNLFPEHRPNFIKMMKECRRYSPDLVLLNHRLELGEGMLYATTFLFQGVETYVDVHICNNATAPHHRQFMFGRGNVPGLQRLTEDHGVCISSYNNYFEDDLIIQAFGRCLILAPEIYGNPFLLRDDEQARLARIYNLHYRFRDILVYGMLLPGGTYPENAVSRGSGKNRFLTFGNDSWQTRTVKIRLDREIGLEPCDKVTVSQHFPYEKFIGDFSYGDIVYIDNEAFRACLLQICDSKESDVMLKNCEYEIIREENGTPVRIRLVSSDGNIEYTNGRPFSPSTESFDETTREPELIAQTEGCCDIPENAEKLYETAIFVQDHDSLEARAAKEAGASDIPQVVAAREAFFGQKTYKLRGCEARFAFDGKDDTFFDGQSLNVYGSGFRIDGGCLRIDFGECLEADSIEFDFFDINEQMLPEMPKQLIPAKCDFSAELEGWRDTTLEAITDIGSFKTEAVIFDVHNIVEVNGRKRTVSYPINGVIRYFRMPSPLYRIYAVRLVRNGKAVPLSSPKMNNLLPYKRELAYAKQCELTVTEEKWRDGCYLAIGLEGKHGSEGAYAVIEDENGKIYGCPDRAVGYATNAWECPCRVYGYDSFFTYFFPVPYTLCGKKLKIHVLGTEKAFSDYAVSVHLCDDKNKIKGVTADFLN